MMAEYIDKEKTLSAILACQRFVSTDYIKVLDAYDAVRSIPVSPVFSCPEIEEAISTALQLLDTIRLRSNVSYGDYSDLHSAISAIMQEPEDL